jgi:hypothetical protein
MTVFVLNSQFCLSFSGVFMRANFWKICYSATQLTHIIFQILDNFFINIKLIGISVVMFVLTVRSQ